MSWLCDSSELVPGGWLTSVYPGHGILGAAIPTAGDHPSPALNDGIQPDAEYRWQVVSWPTAGVLDVYEDLSFVFDAAGIPVGIYPWTYRLWDDGIPVGTATVTMTVGNASGTISALAIGAAVATGTAQHAVQVAPSAIGIGLAEGVASPTATIRITAAGLAEAAGAAGLSASVLLAAAGSARAAGNTALGARLDALAAGTAEASGTARMSGGAAGDLSAVGQVTANGNGLLTVMVQLAAVGGTIADGSATGTAAAPGKIFATGGAEAGGSALWSATVTLTAAGFVQATGAGALFVDVTLGATGAGAASGQALASLAAGVSAYCISSSVRRVTEIVPVVRVTTTIHHEVRCVCD